MKWGASGMMKNHPYKKYIYAAVSLFGVIVLSIIVFFIIFRYGEIKQALRHIFNAVYNRSGAGVYDLSAVQDN